MRQLLRISALAVCFLPLTGCATSEDFPSSLMNQVDRAVSFIDLKRDPSAYQGRLFLAGGSVVSTRRLKDRTLIEILQLPLDNSLKPAGDLTQSQGRFLVFQEGFLDPAIFPAGTRITVVGEITGSITLPLDEVEYSYPSLKLKHLVVWPRTPPAGYWSPYGYPWRPVYPWPFAPVPK